MDIREIELAVGMTRANIRFYEQEGLLTPERRPNGYRDYSGDDVETLKKIKLLRQLHLSVDTIRQLQTGERDLDSALAEAEREMSDQAEDLKRAESVCRTMRSDKVSYASLDAQRYLDAINAPPVSRTDYFSLRSDETPRVRSPWRRWLARSLDFSIYDFLLTALFQLAFRIREMPSILELYLPFVLLLIVEPILLCTWGTTPGKWVLGLETRDFRGRKLSWEDAFARTWGVFGKGYGYGIPIYNFVRMYKCYKACSARGETLPWEEEFTYTLKDNQTVLRGMAWVGITALCLFLALFVRLQAQMPPNRGELTAQEFVENCNDLNRYFDLLPGYTLDENGRWQPGPNGAWNDEESFELLMKDGEFSGVRLEIKKANRFYYYGEARKFLAIMALQGASREVNCFTVGNLRALDYLEVEFESYSLTEAGWRVTQEVEYRGWEYVNGTVLYSDEDEEPYYHMVFTVEAVDG